MGGFYCMTGSSEGGVSVLKKPYSEDYLYLQSPRDNIVSKDVP